jgi:hypothetical protein
MHLIKHCFGSIDKTYLFNTDMARAAARVFFHPRFPFAKHYIFTLFIIAVNIFNLQTPPLQTLLTDTINGTAVLWPD